MKSLKEHLLDERKQDVMDIVGILRSNRAVIVNGKMIKLDTISKFEAYMKEFHPLKVVGKGAYSVAYSKSNVETQYILKETDVDRNDPFIEYAEIAKEQHKYNDLFPEIVYIHRIEDTYYTFIEAVEVFAEKASKHFGYYKAAFDDLEDYALGDKSWEDVIRRSGETFKEMGFPEDKEDVSKFKDWLEKIAKLGGLLDLHDENFGHRKDGSIVLFDPKA